MPVRSAAPLDRLTTRQLAAVLAGVRGLAVLLALSATACVGNGLTLTRADERCHERGGELMESYHDSPHSHVAARRCFRPADSIPLGPRQSAEVQP